MYRDIRYLKYSCDSHGWGKSRGDKDVHERDTIYL